MFYTNTFISPYSSFDEQTQIRPSVSCLWGIMFVKLMLTGKRWKAVSCKAVSFSIMKNLYAVNLKDPTFELPTAVSTMRLTHPSPWSLTLPWSPSSQRHTPGWSAPTLAGVCSSLHSTEPLMPWNPLKVLGWECDWRKREGKGVNMYMGERES